MMLGFPLQLAAPQPSFQCHSPKPSSILRTCNSTVNISSGNTQTVSDSAKFFKFHLSAEKNNGIIKTSIKNSRLSEMYETLDNQKEQLEIPGNFRNGNGDFEINPNEFVELLRECARQGSVREGKGIHGFLLKIGLDDETTVLLNHVAHMYANCGNLVGAHQVFDEIPHRNVFSWTVMIVGSTQNGFPLDGFRFFREMQKSGIRPDKHAFSAVLQSCIGLESVDPGRMVHAQISKSICSNNVFVCTSLLNMYAKFGEIKDSDRVFETMDAHNQVTWNAMISGYAQNNLNQEAFNLFLRMKRQCFESNLYTFASVLKACGKLGDQTKGKEIHNYVRESNLESNVIVGTALIDMYAKCGSLSDARFLFDHSFIDCKENMPWNAMISGYSQSGNSEKALDLFNQMHSKNIQPDIFTYGSIFNSCADLKSLQRGRALHGIVVKRSNCLQILTVNNALAYTYAKCGCLDDARKIFERMEIRDVVSWTTMVTAYAQNLEGDKALHIFLQMKLENVIPNQFTFASVLVGCANISILDCGKQIHGQICKSGFYDHVCVESALIDMYSKCGSIIDAQKVFEKVVNPDVVTWTAIILGYALHGSTMVSLELFNRMAQAGIQANAVTILCVLFACSHGGMVDEGLDYFRSMREKYNVFPEMEHYACVVDLLGRVGRLNEALEFINDMPMEPTATIWQTLLGACRVHGNVELGKIAAQKIISVKPEVSATYVLLSNTYIATGSLEDGLNLRNIMKERDVKKEPGNSWIVVRGRVHKFFARDKVHPRKKEIYAKLDELREKMKAMGYIPDLTFAMQEMD